MSAGKRAVQRWVGPAVLVLVLSTAVAAPNAEAASSDRSTGAGAALPQGQANSAAKSYLEGRLQHVVTRLGAAASVDQGLTSGRSQRLALVDAGRDAAVDAQRTALASAGDEYSASRTSTRVLSMRRDGDDRLAQVVENTELTFAGQPPGAPTSTAYEVNREFRFSRQGGRWVISDMRLLGNGPAPLIDITPASPPPATTPGLAAPAGTRTGTALAGRRGDPARNAGASKPGTAPRGATGPAAVAASAYDYGGMVNYARYWAFSYNGSYRSWPNDDCTNFMSQALRAGGWGMVSGYYTSTDAWWYNWLNQSRTWINAHYWYWFTQNQHRTTLLGNVWDSLPSDVIQADWNRDLFIDHTMMVTGRAGYGYLYMTYHTNNTRDRPLTEILNQSPSAYYWAHRT